MSHENIALQSDIVVKITFNKAIRYEINNDKPQKRARVINNK